MKTRSLFALTAIAATAITALIPAAHAQTRPLSQDTLRANGGTIRIIPKFHASTQIEYQGKVIAVDPILFGTWTKKADLVLITHSHSDHLDLPAIAKLLKKGTIIVAPPSVVPTIRTIRTANTLSISPGAVFDYKYATSPSRSRSASVKIQPVPMYNIKRGPEPGKKYHPKENRWTGYVVTLGGKRLYLAGDTEATPEMKALKKIDAAFLPMNLPYTMTPEEAATAAKAFRPAVVYPYHFRYPFDKANDHVSRFTTALKGSRVKVKLLDWYPQSGIQKFLAASKQNKQ